MKTSLLVALILLGTACAVPGKVPPKRPDFSKPRPIKISEDDEFDGCKRRCAAPINSTTVAPVSTRCWCGGNHPPVPLPDDK